MMTIIRDVKPPRSGPTVPRLTSIASPPSEAGTPMARSQAAKAQSHERILAAAAAAIRDAGLESVSVGALMRSVDLTHGGFYRHFPSRAELLACALERALHDGEAAANAAHEASRTSGYGTIVRNYLSRGHRDARASGCAIAALASDVARADVRCRAVTQAHVERFVDKMARALGDRDDSRAVLAAGAMIGGLLLARMTPDPKRSDEILRKVRDGLLALERAPAKPATGGTPRRTHAV